MNVSTDGSSSPPETFHAELNMLEKELSTSSDRQQSLRKFSNGLSLGIFLLFIIYIGAFAKHIQNNFSQEAFRNSIESHMDEAEGLATEFSVDVVKEAGPTYLAQIDEESKTFVPNLLINFEQQSAILVSNMAKFARTEYDIRLKRVMKDQEKAFKQAYPDITDAELKQFLWDTEQDLDNMMSVVSKEIVDKTAPAIGEMKALAESLTDGKKLPDEDFELIRLFLHNLLILMDKEVTEG